METHKGEWRCDGSFRHVFGLWLLGSGSTLLPGLLLKRYFSMYRTRSLPAFECMITLSVCFFTWSFEFEVRVKPHISNWVYEKLCLCILVEHKQMP